jgi:hypothetical protein
VLVGLLDGPGVVPAGFGGRQVEQVCLLLVQVSAA